MAKILFAPDGEHFQIIKRGTTQHLWDYFNFERSLQEQICLNPFAKFRLVGDIGITIGERGGKIGNATKNEI